MKKRIALLVVLGIALAIGCQNNVFGYSPHYLPGGTNYLSKDNFSYVGETDYYKSVEPFLVKSYQQYTLTIEREYGDGLFGDITIEFYNNETYLSSLELTIDEFYCINYEDNSLFTSTFMTSSNTNYISITFLDNNRYFDSESFYVQLEEGDEFTDFEVYEDGELIDTAAPYFQNSGTIISYYDSPITIDEIKSTLIAYDAIDGDVSSSITLVSDNYTNNIDELGTYQCVFSVSDSSQNTEEVVITVELVDVLSPVFTELETLQAVYPNVYTVENVLERLSASDNYDGDISSDIVLVNDEYSLNSNVVGTYEMEFAVTDSSGNSTTYIQNIEVIDNEGPIISGVTEVIVGYDSLLTQSDITMNLNYTDNYDSQESLELILESDSYTENSDKIGTYEMVFSVTDSNGNKTTEIITVEVVDEIGPAIYFNSSVIQTYSNNVMSLPDFTKLLINTNEMMEDKEYSVTVEYDSYTRNASIPGTYHLKLNFEDETGDTFDKDFEIVVVDRPADYFYSKIEAEEPENQLENEGNQYIIGGILAGFLIVSNVVWAVVFKKKH